MLTPTIRVSAPEPAVERMERLVRYAVEGTAAVTVSAATVLVIVPAELTIRTEYDPAWVEETTGITCDAAVAPGIALPLKSHW